MLSNKVGIFSDLLTFLKSFLSICNKIKSPTMSWFSLILTFTYFVFCLTNLQHTTFGVHTNYGYKQIPPILTKFQLKIFIGTNKQQQPTNLKEKVQHYIYKLPNTIHYYSRMNEWWYSCVDRGGSYCIVPVLETQTQTKLYQLSFPRLKRLIGWLAPSYSTQLNDWLVGLLALKVLKCVLFFVYF